MPWSEEQESLDDAWTARLDPGELAQNLTDLARIKRWLGLHRDLCRALRPGGGRRELRVLDVATGGGDVPAQLIGCAGNETDLRVQVVGVDLHPQVIREARRRQAEPGVAFVRGDGLRLPMADRGVDAALCMLSLHHFAPEEARTLLQEMARVSREHIIVIDFVRSRRAYVAAWLLTHLLGPGHRLSRRDGPLSIRRAYTLAEMRRLAAAARLAGAQVRPRAPFLAVLEVVLAHSPHQHEP